MCVYVQCALVYCGGSLLFVLCLFVLNFCGCRINTWFFNLIIVDCSSLTVMDHTIPITERLATTLDLLSLKRKRKRRKTDHNNNIIGLPLVTLHAFTVTLLFWSGLRGVLCK